MEPASTTPDAAAHPWDDYLIGPENELALAAAQALARGEREGISPLVVHGPSGVGKSRLLAGLVAERLRRQPGSAVAHLDAESFAAACVEAAGEPGVGGWSALRGRFRAVDLFVVEDLEGLERVPMARDELAHTLDALETSGASVAVSTRAAPGSWRRLGWPARLINRLLGGLAARIDPPGLASRRRYVLLHAAARGLALQAEAVETIAQAADGYRTLDGWLARLALETQLDRRQEARGGPPGGRGPQSRRSGSAPLDPQAVATVLAEETALAEPVATVDAIARAVAERFGVRLALLRGPSRRASVVEARHLAMHLARLHSGTSFAAIGAYFGGRDPATVRHACKAAVLRLDADAAHAAAVAALGRAWRKSDARPMDAD
jgi:chromosomal replication initiator protein